MNLWSIGESPFGPFTKTNELSKIYIDLYKRNTYIVSLDAYKTSLVTIYNELDKFFRTYFSSPSDVSSNLLSSLYIHYVSTHLFSSYPPSLQRLFTDLSNSYAEYLGLLSIYKQLQTTILTTSNYIPIDDSMEEVYIFQKELYSMMEHYSIQLSCCHLQYHVYI
ncbi:hypothetical protein WA158_003062 [Blastocystis sp. Blastoise]